MWPCTICSGSSPLFGDRKRDEAGHFFLSKKIEALHKLLSGERAVGFPIPYAGEQAEIGRQHPLEFFLELLYLRRERGAFFCLVPGQGLCGASERRFELGRGGFCFGLAAKKGRVVW